MTTYNTTDLHQISIPRGVLATRYIFLVLGLAISIWAALIPFIKNRLQLNEAELGGLLLLIGTGALLSMPWAGWLTNRWGCRKTLNRSTSVFLMALVLLGYTSNVFFFAVMLFIFGMSSGVIDIAMNIQASLIEKMTDRRFMSSFHGMYSLGGFLGALLFSFLLKLGLSALWAMILFSIVMISGNVFIFQRYFFPFGIQNSTKSSPFIRPKGIILFLSVLCFIFYLSDGVVLDWGALLMISKGAHLELAGMAFSIFSIAITVGRLWGDQLINRFGAKTMITASGVTALVGFTVLLIAFSPFVAIIGFCIIGLGVSNLIPILFSYASQQSIVPISQAVSSITTLGYLGLMSGPPLMGFIAHHFHLTFVFIIVAVLIFIASCLARKFLH